MHFEISLADPEALAADVRATGAAAPLLLLVLLVVQSVAAPLPSQPVLMAAGFVYGALEGLAIGWLGVLLGALATALGEIPKVLVFTTLGAGLGRIPGWIGVAVAASAIASVGIVLLLRRSAVSRSGGVPVSRTPRSTS